MSLAIVYSRALQGLAAPLVTVEVHLANGLPKFSIVGLAETAVKESKDRVRSAIVNNQFTFPCKRVTVNLAPADLPKEGGRFDLAIAIGILAASHQISRQQLAQHEIVGELALSGAIRSIKGALPTALKTVETKKELILPYDNCEEAALVDHLSVLPAKGLLDVCKHLNLDKKITPFVLTQSQQSQPFYPALNEVIGQESAKRALLIAASGGHNLLMSGPPGTGKSMLANRLPGLLPPISKKEQLEINAIYSVSEDRKDTLFNAFRPFRAPHHTCSSFALVGGGRLPKPGEISLAHRGVLFLDELPEFSRHSLEALREPMETGQVTISRAAVKAQFPANFQLIAAMNPCPCGHLNNPQVACRCDDNQIKRYQHKLSGPFLDRMDLFVEVLPLNPELLFNKRSPEKKTQAGFVEAVYNTHDRQMQRQQKTNAELSAQEIEQHCQLNSKCETLLKQTAVRQNLSARIIHRILKVARTVADFEQHSHIIESDLMEAIYFRCRT